MTKYSESLKGTKDMMKELNKDGGRYLPVWMKPDTPIKSKTKEGTDARRTRNIRVNERKTPKKKKKEKGSSS